MSSILDTFPLALMLPALLIPLVYCAVWKGSCLRKMFALWLMAVVIVLLYPVMLDVTSGAGSVGYFFSKLILFVAVPIAFLMWMEGWTLGTVMEKVGVRREEVGMSVFYGIIVAAITIPVTVIVSTAASVNLGYDIVLFLDAFSEEFLFRGVLFLYLMARTNLPVAFVTSVLAFVLVHPGNFSSLFILSTALQAVLLTWVVFKTDNIIGAWVSHGLNRVIPPMIRVGLGL